MDPLIEEIMICKYMGWNHDDYENAPTQLVESIHIYMNAERRQANKK